MAHAFFLGVDLEREEDAGEAVLTILEKDQERTDADVSYRLVHARDRTEASADELAAHIQSLGAERPYIGRTTIVVNRRRAVGQALVDALTERGLDPVAVTLTDGSGAVPGETDEVGVSLGLIDAVQTLAELYRDEQVVIEDYSTEVASRLARGVQRAAEVLDEVDGNQNTPQASGATLDALGEAGAAVRSAALAAWCGAERSFDPSQHLKEDPQTGRPDGGAPGR